MVIWGASNVKINPHTSFKHARSANRSQSTCCASSLLVGTRGHPCRPGHPEKSRERQEESSCAKLEVLKNIHHPRPLFKKGGEKIHHHKKSPLQERSSNPTAFSLGKKEAACSFSGRPESLLAQVAFLGGVGEGFQLPAAVQLLRLEGEAD